MCKSVSTYDQMIMLCRRDVQKKCIRPRKNAHPEKWIMSELSDSLLYNLFIMYSRMCKWKERIKATFETQQAHDHFNQNYFQSLSLLLSSLFCQEAPGQCSQVPDSFLHSSRRQRAGHGYHLPPRCHSLGGREGKLVEMPFGKKNTQQHPWNLLWERLRTCWAWERKRLPKKSTEKAKTHVKALTHQKTFSYNPLANLMWFLL